MTALAAKLGRNRASAKAGDPVDTSTGNFYMAFTDVEPIAGKGVPLSFTRHYNSQAPEEWVVTDWSSCDEQNPDCDWSTVKCTGGFSARWSHTYSMRMVTVDEGKLICYPDGHGAVFTGSQYNLQAPDGTFETLVRISSSVYDLTTPDQVKYRFTSGKLTSIRDRNNNTTTLTYPSSTQMVVTDPSGRTLTFTTTSSGKITSVTDPLGRQVTYSYHTYNGTLQTVSAAGGSTTFSYDSSRMTSIVDANGHSKVSNTYNSSNKVSKQVDAVGGVTCFYIAGGTHWGCPSISPGSSAGNTIVVDPRGNKTKYDFDSDFRTTKITDHYGGFKQFVYNNDDLITCTTDELGKKTKKTYNGYGRVLTLIDANNTDSSCNLKSGGVQWTYTYTSKQDVDLATDPLGRKVDYTYDANGNLTQVDYKDASNAVKRRTCYTRNSAGQVTERTESTTLSDCTGNKTKFEYDSYGRQTAVIDPRFAAAGTPKTTMTYDLASRKLTETNELGHTTTWTYNALNKVLTVKDNLNNTTTNTYDAVGNHRTVTDALGKVTTYNYDNADRLTSVVDALSQTTSYGLDGNGNRTSVTNARGKTTTYVYDALNRLQNGQASFQYDAASRLTQRTDARGLAT